MSPVVNVREKPSLRLSAHVTLPDGTHARLGDEGAAKDAMQDLTFSTVMPGGFESATFGVERDPRRLWPDIQPMSTVTIMGAGGASIAGEYRLNDRPDSSGQDRRISPALVGWQKHLDDDMSASLIVVDQELGNWGDMPLARQIGQSDPSGTDPTYLFGSSSVVPDAAGNPRLILTIQDSWVAPNQPEVEMWYDGQGAKIGTIWYDVTISKGATSSNWEARVGLTDVENPGPIALSPNAYVGGGVSTPETSGYFSTDPATRWAIARWRWTTTGGGGSQGLQRDARYRLAVYGPHGLPLYGNAPGGVHASDVVAYALGQWCPELNFTTGQFGTIQDSDFVIPQMVFLDMGGVSRMVIEAVKYELLDWAVWEYKTFWLAPRRRGSNVKFWRVRSDEIQLQQTGMSADRMWNGVVVSFTGIDGRTHYVGPPDSGLPDTDDACVDNDPQNPINELGMKKYALVDMGMTSTTLAAIKIAQRFLQELKVLDRSGAATVTGHIMDDRGVIWPAWKMRAGDYVSIIDAQDTSYRRIVNTSYSARDGANSLQLDAPPDRLQALLERLGVAIAPLGL